MMRKLFFRQLLLFVNMAWRPGLFVAGGVVLLLWPSCAPEKNEEPADHRLATEVTLDWNHLMLDLERHTPGYRPPVSARAFAYVGMAAYEAALPALPDHISLERLCPGFQRPATGVPKEHFYLPASLNAAYAGVLRHFFAQAPAKWREKIDETESKHAACFQKKAGKYPLGLSAGYGQAVAQAVWEWSATDPVGHTGYLTNTDMAYTPPACPGCWQPDAAHPVRALLPHWGEARSFVATPEEMECRQPTSFDETPGSAFHTEAVEVFSVSQPLSKENVWIAELWSDDLPGLTVTPAGRWISIANQAVDKAQPPFATVIEMYVKTGIALCDAGIVAWHEKYRFNLERPQAYITRNIRAEWTPLHENPPFPAYPSGHSAFGAAAAEVLSAMFGASFQLTDRTHENRQEFVGKPRMYQSFTEMARENAASRVLMGVHYRMDCEEGLRIGKIIGRQVAALPLSRKEAAVMQ
jgi:hypothetical protein